MVPQKVAELVSLGLTIPTITLCVMVVILWGPPAVTSLIRNDKRPTAWFMFGVTAGFLGSALDNIYWGIAWTSSYLELESTSSLFAKGAYFNIFFRQLMGIIAASCHVMAAKLTTTKGARGINIVLVAAHLLGVAFAGLLYAL